MLLVSCDFFLFVPDAGNDGTTFEVAFVSLFIYFPLFAHFGGTFLNDGSFLK